MTDPKKLERVSKESKNKKAREAALRKISGQVLLEIIAKEGVDSNVRVNIIKKPTLWSLPILQNMTDAAMFA
jgi:hypothetical protein